MSVHCNPIVSATTCIFILLLSRFVLGRGVAGKGVVKGLVVVTNVLVCALWLQRFRGGVPGLLRGFRRYRDYEVFLCISVFFATFCVI